MLEQVFNSSNNNSNNKTIDTEHRVWLKELYLSGFYILFFNNVLWVLIYLGDKRHCRTLYMKWSEVAQLCLTLCDPMKCSPLGSSVHGIFRARILKWVAISFSRDLPDPGIKPGSCTLQADSLPSEALFTTREAHYT